MSNKFTRNITGTKLKGEIKEPFTTNVQNDLLSDDTDVYVRQERSKKINNQYHCLTDNVKEVISNSDLISTVNFNHEKDGQEEKNKSYINVNKSNKSESEKMESNSHVMTPLQTGYSIEKNNRDVIPSLVKEHETPTEIESKSDELKVTKKGKNNFELELVLNENGEIDITSDNEVIEINKNGDNSFTLSVKPEKFYTVRTRSSLTLDDKFYGDLIEMLGTNQIRSNKINNLIDRYGIPISPADVSGFIDEDMFKDALNRIVKRIIEIENRLEELEK